jgi:hypothetical protein
MSNPWTKKNPWMSLWLSGANTVLGSARAAWLREAHRQNQVFVRESRRLVADFWLGPTPARRKKRRR